MFRIFPYLYGILYHQIELDPEMANIKENYGLKWKCAKKKRAKRKKNIPSYRVHRKYQNNARSVHIFSHTNEQCEQYEHLDAQDIPIDWFQDFEFVVQYTK